MGIFFIIFAIIFWAALYSIDKCKAKKAESLKESQFSLQENMRKELVASKEVMDAVYSKIYYGADCTAVFDELNEELTLVYGEDYIPKVKIRKTREPSIQYSDDGYWICQLLLAKQGKVGICEVSSGYYLGDHIYAQRNIKYCQQIEKLLKRNVLFGKAYMGLYLTPKRYSIKEEYQFPINMNSMNFLFNLQSFADQDIVAKGKAWEDIS